jgi:hypothetical protein
MFYREKIFFNELKEKEKKLNKFCRKVPFVENKSSEIGEEFIGRIDAIGVSDSNELSKATKKSQQVFVERIVNDNDISTETKFNREDVSENNAYTLNRKQSSSSSSIAFITVDDDEAMQPTENKTKSHVMELSWSFLAFKK